MPKSTPAKLDPLAARGLTEAEALRRLDQVGLNEPVPARRGGPLAQFVHFCTNPLVLILLVASAISALLGQIIDSVIIAAMVILSIVLNFFQAYRSGRAVEELRNQVAPSATVLRDGEWVETPRRHLVPGDVVRLAAGDLVPADARLLVSQDLLCIRLRSPESLCPLRSTSARPLPSPAVLPPPT